MIAVVFNVTNTVFSDSAPLAIITGTTIKAVIRNAIISRSKTSIIRNDQKLDAAPLKKCDIFILLSELLRTENRPPLKNTFIRNPVKITKINPEENADKTGRNPVPVFAITSRSNPLFSFSVIILDPMILLIPDFSGWANSVTSNNELNQIISIHFHDLSERSIPDLRWLNMLIKDTLQGDKTDKKLK